MNNILTVLRFGWGYLCGCWVRLACGVVARTAAQQGMFPPNARTAWP